MVKLLEKKSLGISSLSLYRSCSSGGKNDIFLHRSSAIVSNNRVATQAKLTLDLEVQRKSAFLALQLADQTFNLYLFFILLLLTLAVVLLHNSLVIWPRLTFLHGKILVDNCFFYIFEQEVHWFCFYFGVQDHVDFSVNCADDGDEHV